MLYLNTYELEPKPLPHIAGDRHTKQSGIS